MYKRQGYTLVPLQVYFKGSLVKVEVGLARGKKLYDKRADIAKKDQRREMCIRDRYYCDPSGAMLVSTVTPDGFTVGADGARLGQ